LINYVPFDLAQQIQSAILLIIPGYSFEVMGEVTHNPSYEAFCWPIVETESN
jgi:hypothetical protein